MAKTRECDGFAEDYSALLDGELEAPREAQLRAHVESCAHCEAQLEALERVGAVLRAAPAPAVPNDLRARLQQKIEVESSRIGTPARPPSRRAAADLQPPLRTPRRARPGSFGIRPAVWIGAAVAAAAAVALILLQSGAREGRDSFPCFVAEVPTPLAQTEDPAPTSPFIAATQPSVEPTLELMDLESSSDREIAEIAVALELDTLEDLDVIANLELLERLVALEEGTG